MISEALEFSRGRRTSFLVEGERVSRRWCMGVVSHGYVELGGSSG